MPASEAGRAAWFKDVSEPGNGTRGDRGIARGGGIAPPRAADVALAAVRCADASAALCTQRLVLSRWGEGRDVRLYEALRDEETSERLLAIPFARCLERDAWEAQEAREHSLWSRGERFNFIIFEKTKDEGSNDLTGLGEEYADALAAEAHHRFVLSGCKPIGCAGIVDVDERNLVAQIGVFVVKAAEGRGLASEAVAAVEHLAFAELGMERAELRTDSRNEACCRLAERCGYTREATLRSNFVGPTGFRNDTAIFGKLRSEWQRARGGVRAFL